MEKNRSSVSSEADMEESVRLVISYIVFRRKKWMQQL